MNRPVVLNARFRVQALTGVQRFAGEIAAALARVWPAARPPLVELKPDRGGLAGQLWEQAILPWRAGGAVQVHLGNTAPLFGRRVVVIHDAGVFATPEAYGTAFRAWYGFLHRALLAGGARVATVSEFSRRELARALGADPARIPVLGEGAEHILRPAPDPAILARHNLRPGHYALAVGSLVAHKNLAALAPLGEALAARGDALAITGSVAPGVFAASGVRLPERAIYVGRVGDAELRALYESAACFVLPSRYEGFGLPAVEAMACGCPVVAARAGALPEICADAALYADPANPADFAQAALRVIDDPALAATLRAAGRARAAEHTWDRAAARLRDVILAMEPAR